MALLAPSPAQGRGENFLIALVSFRTLHSEHISVNLGHGIFILGLFISSCIASLNTYSGG